MSAPSSANIDDDSPVADDRGPRSRPVPVAFVIDTLRPGAGTENQLILLLRSMDRRRVEPHLVCLRPDDALSTLQLGCPVHVLELGSMASLGGLLGAARLWTLLRRERIQVVSTFFRDANLVGSLVALAAGLPVLGNRRNVGYWHNPLELLRLRALNAMTALIVANSEAARRTTVEVEGVPGSSVRVIRNAIVFAGSDPVDGARARLRGEFDVPGDAPLVACVATLRSVKGHSNLLSAFAAVHEAVPDARLVLVGDGEERQPLARLAERLGIANRVLFLGNRHDVPQILAASDLAVLASRSESLSNALLECLAAGLPSVATAVGGNPELVEHGFNGLLVPAEQPEPMAEALIRLCLDAELRDRMGRSAARRVRQRFDLQTILERWYTVFDELALSARSLP